MSGVNKVVFGGETVIDLTADSVTADVLLEGYTAHDKGGNAIAGTFTIDPELTEMESKIAQLSTILDSKAAGSGGSGGDSGGSTIETCTVEITVAIALPGASYMHVSCTSFENGAFLCKSSFVGDIPETSIPAKTIFGSSVGGTCYAYTLTNVVCNSAITFTDANYNVSGELSVDGTAELYSFDEDTADLTIKAPSVAGETCAITIS